MPEVSINEDFYHSYLDALLAGKRSVCHQMVQEILKKDPDIKDLYVHLFQRALYEVGELWEKNKISVATEHIATAITESLLTLVYPVIFGAEHFGKKGLIACVPNEYHQIGAKMVADTFELNGWDGYFVGANTPTTELIDQIGQVQPDVIGLSLSIYFNLPQFETMLGEIKKEFPETPVWAGGQAFRWGGSEVLEKYPGTLLITSLHDLEKQLQNNI